MTEFLQRHFLNNYITHHCIWRAFLAPAQQFVNFFFGSCGNDLYVAIGQVHHFSFYTKCKGFFPGALPVIHSLHFSCNEYGYSDEHIYSEGNKINDLLQVMLVSDVKFIVFIAVSIQYGHYIIFADNWNNDL